jgi:Uncharacterized protein conserved in bacteria
MAGALRKTMLYLGLADDRGEYEAEQYVDDYEEYDEQPEAPMATEHEAQVTPIRQSARGAELRRITTVHPRSYNDARTIGEAFRSGTPVIMNLTDMDDADAKRLVDFAAGLIFGLHGAIERVTAKVFLLSPAHVEIAGETTSSSGSSPSFYNQS